MPDLPEKSEKIKGQLLRQLNDSWLEYLTPEGRKLYQNHHTGEISWKPPRKQKEQKVSSKRLSSNSLPTNTDENVGGILRKGTLKIFNDKKRKWKKSVAYLTNTHFVYKQDKNWKEGTEKISLSNAVVKRDFKRKGVYELTNMKIMLHFKAKKNLESEAWYHAIAAIIHNLSLKPIHERPQSYYNAFDNTESLHAFTFDFTKQDENINHITSLRAIDQPRKVPSESDLNDFFSGIIHRFDDIKVASKFDSSAKTHSLSSRETLLLSSIDEEDADETGKGFDMPKEKMENSSEKNLSAQSSLPTEEKHYDETVESGTNTLIEKELDETKGIARNKRSRHASQLEMPLPSPLQGGKSSNAAPQNTKASTEIDNLEETREKEEKHSISGSPEMKQSFRREDITPFVPKIKYPTPPGWVAKFDGKRREYLYENTGTLEEWAAVKRNDQLLFYNTEKTTRNSWLLPPGDNTKKETSV